MIIDRYLVREVIHPFLVVVFLLFSIFVTFSLARFLVDAGAGLLKISEVVQLTTFKALISLEVILPLSFYLAVMIGLGQLHSNAEIYAMKASGISERRLLRPIMGLALVLAMAVCLLSIVMRPWAYMQIYEIKAAAAASSEIERIKPARFYVFDDLDRTVYIEQITGSDLKGVFVRTRQDGNLQVITAATGQFQHLARPAFHRIRLADARVFKKVKDGPDFFARFGTFALWMPVERPKQVRYSADAVDTRLLRHSKRPEEKAEYQWRLSTPLSTLLLALLAMPLSRSRPRQGRYSRMLLSLVVYALFFIMLDISRSWVQQGLIDSIWWVPGLLGLVVVHLYLPRTRRNRRGGRRHAG